MISNQLFTGIIYIYFEDGYKGRFKMKNIKNVLAICAVLTLGSTMVYAGTSYKTYSTTVGRFNGNGYTAYQTKSISGANGGLSSHNVGADYVVDVRMQEDDGTAGSWTRNVDDNSYYDLDGNVNHKQGDYIRLHFSNDWNTPVAVQVDGSWKSN